MGWMGRVFLGCTVLTTAQAQEVDLVLTDAAADRFAALALRCVRAEYPNKLDHVMNGAASTGTRRCTGTGCS